MKLIKLILILIALLPINHLYAQQQKERVITGRVLDDLKIPFPYVSVLESGVIGNGTRTDAEGKFRLALKGSSNKLEFKFLGYLTKTVPVGESSVVNITMEVDAKGLEEVVIVGQGTQKRITNTGAISAIKGEEIKGIPTSSLQNTLVGRLPGLFSQQGSGQPGNDAATFYIRGVNSLNGDTKPLIIVDDIEYEYSQVQQLNPNEVESVTLLKDASTTAIYGIRGANGVLVITTKRGSIGKPQVNFSSDFGFNRFIKMPTFLDAYTTALLKNEATINDSYGSSSIPTLPFSQEDLELYKNGNDPFGHPNVNWSDVLFDKMSAQNRYNLDFSGGKGKVKYFTSLGYYTQDGQLKQFSPTVAGDDVNNKYFYRRTNFRSNLDITPISSMKLRFDINGRFETKNDPGGVQNVGGLFRELYSYFYLPSLAMPVTNPDGSYGYGVFPSGNGVAHPINRLANGGYKRSFMNNFNIVGGIDQKLEFITKGLSAKGTLSYASNINEYRNLTRNLTDLPSFFYDSESGTYTIKDATKYKYVPYSLNTGADAFNNTIVLQALLSYDRVFGDHHVYGLGMFNQRSYSNKEALSVNYRGSTLRLGYDFKRKYLLEFNIARNGNDVFREEERYGIFPAASIGWNLSEEKFFKNAFPFFDLFKLRASHGLVGSDATYPTKVEEEIIYTQNDKAGEFGFGTGAVSSGARGNVNGLAEGALVNRFVTWEKERKTNIGMDVNMFNGKIALTADYFYNFRYDQLIDQGDVNLIIGQVLPKKNIGETSNKGFDGSLTYRSRTRNVDYSIGLNASYAINKIVYVSESPDFPYLARTGTQIGQPVGYISMGFYQLNDFDASGNIKAGIPVYSGALVQPGDIRYKDLNGDGAITSADRTYFGKPQVPTTTLGLNLSASFKGFYLNALVQGAWDYSVRVAGEGSDAYFSNFREWHLERWTPATANTATYPRLGIDYSKGTNYSWNYLSDFWFADASYVRLKSLELGYNIPQSWLPKNAFIRNARIYGNGYNLVNINNMGKFEQDAEVASGTGDVYPNTAIFNFGFQLGF
ncbi:SusC/RagA family TonB-linked outer membrane protein [Desertivirga xinjiangensis]|uniref:SusC/RagA family TonB-linked outer membrane protein n=1 Tax=Desertivirga xinjiangensis TaxID=539206 RepID=UPI00210ABEB1|nr:TonB-dependent receptor [Pedobacter xinjiangensis]